MNKCQKCGEEYPEYFPECPVCGAKNQLPKNRSWLAKNWAKAVLFFICAVTSYMLIVNHGSRIKERAAKSRQKQITLKDESEKRNKERANENMIREKEKRNIAEKIANVQRVQKEKDDAVHNLSFDFKLYKKSTSTMTVDVAIGNNSQLGMKDFVVQCDLSGASGTTIQKKQIVVRQQLFPGQKIRVNNLFIGFVDQQVTNGSCRVINATF